MSEEKSVEVIKLKRPVKNGDVLVSELSLDESRLTAGDIMDVPAGRMVMKDLKLVMANCAAVPINVIEKMAPSDYIKCYVVLERFLMLSL